MHTLHQLGKLTLICLCWFVAACDTSPMAEGDETDPTTEPPQEYVVEEIIPSGDEKYLNEDASVVFDQLKLHTFELTLPTASLAKLDADPAAEEYVEGSLSFEGETLSPIGIRYKGSIGAFVGCLSGPDFARPSGRKTCTKLSMKVKINWSDSDNKFYGLKKLQFHSMNQDPTQMRERLGYWMFREMGVPAPRAVHVRLKINDVYTGVYVLVEQIDGRFTRHNFADGKGNLYKEVWPLDEDGQPFPEKTYINALETNEDENPSARLIQTFAQEVSQADTTHLKEIVAHWMDVDQTLAYVAVDRAIRADDGPFHWYCIGGPCSNHNYYWYEETDQSRLHLIPWDMDNAFENIISNRNPVIPIADTWGNITNNCQPFSFGSFRLMQRSAACDKLTAGWVAFDQEYQQALTKLLQGPLSEADRLMDTWVDQVRAATNEASELHNDALKTSAWNTALSDLKNSLESARNKVSNQIQ